MSSQPHTLGVDHDEDYGGARGPRLADRRAPDVDDPRVQAVLEVLGGRPSAEVAGRWAVAPVVLQRWVHDFLAAGTRQVTNSPAPEAAAQRDRFLAAFAHELRSPLAVAQGWAMMLLEGDIDAGDPRLRQRLAERLQASLATLQERTRDVELLAAASLGRLRLRLERLSVADLTAVLPGLAPGAITGEGPRATLVADRALLSRAVSDMWATAWMEPRPESVGLAVEVVDPWLELRVERHGTPLDPRVLQALLEPFDLNDDGTGVTIGLYLARALTVAHGGTIGVDQVGSETVLWVRVPRTPGPGDEDDRADGRGDDSKDNSKEEAP